MAVDPYQERIAKLRKKAQTNNGSDQKIHNTINKLRGNATQTQGKFTVDPDPKAPNDPSNQAGAGNKGKSNTRAQVYPGGNSTRTAKLGATGTPTPGGESTREPVVGTGVTAITDPRDATYWANVNKLSFERDTQLNQINTDEIYANTTHESNLANLGRQQPKDILAAREAANSGGSFYSSKTSENVGNIQNDYFTRNANENSAFQQEQANRQLMRNALSQGYTVDEAAELAAANNRQSQLEMTNPSPVPPDPTGGSGGGGKGGGKGKGGGGGGGVGGGGKGGQGGGGNGKGKGNGGGGGGGGQGAGGGQGNKGNKGKGGGGSGGGGQGNKGNKGNQGKGGKQGGGNGGSKNPPKTPNKPKPGNAYDNTKPNAGKSNTSFDNAKKKADDKVAADKKKKDDQNNAFKAALASSAAAAAKKKKDEQNAKSKKKK